MTRIHLSLLPAVLALALAGCSSHDEPDLAERIARLETEHRALMGRVDRLLTDLEPLAQRMAEVDKGNQRLSKTMAQVEQDLRARLHEMVQEANNGGWRGRETRRERPVELVAAPAPAPEPPKPYLGFDAQTVSTEVAEQLKLAVKAGVLVTAVRDGAPAAVGGIRKDDVVVQADGADIANKSMLAALIGKKHPGDAVTLGLLREGKKIELTVTLGRQ